jgi:hypothetical protein
MTNFYDQFKDSRLFRKQQKPPFKIYFNWDWYDFGLLFRVFCRNEFSEYYITVDIQILWLNIWFQLFRRKAKSRNTNTP